MSLGSKSSYVVNAAAVAVAAGSNSCSTGPGWGSWGTGYSCSHTAAGTAGSMGCSKD